MGKFEPERKEQPVIRAADAEELAQQIHREPVVIDAHSDYPVHLSRQLDS